MWDLLLYFLQQDKNIIKKEREKNYKDEPGDNLSKKRLKEKKTRRGKAKKEGRWSQKNLFVMHGQ